MQCEVFSLISLKKASAFTEEPGEQDPSLSQKYTRTNTRLPTTETNLYNDELILSRQWPQVSVELCLNSYRKVSGALKTNENTGCEN